MKAFLFFKSSNRKITTLFCFILLVSFQFVQAQLQSVELTVNGKKVSQLTYPQNPQNIPTIEMFMGDDLDFKITASSNSKQYRPAISGLPKVWEAAFAGDMMFHVDPNFEPNTINPFIGLDSRVHTLMMRRYPAGFKVFEKDWNITQQGSNSVYKWRYTAQREMDPAITKYDEGTYYRWPKKHKKKDGTFMNQRQNQKEGLNMKFLYHWNNWLSKSTTFSGLFSGKGKANYMMGFDDDELAYFNHPFKETGENTNHPLEHNPTNTGVAKLETLQWKVILEKRVLYNDMGYPKQGSPLNIMVDAYRKHQNAKKDKNPNIKYTYYNGYEIQDEGTNENNPNGGAGMPNLAHPGLVTIDYDGAKVQVKLRVRNPLRAKYWETVSDGGFYDAIIGPDAPSNAETNVMYHLDGIENHTVSEQRKYKLYYKWMNRLGEIQTKTINPGAALDLERPAYAWLTATYQRTPDSEPVIIAGKELNQIFLMFCGVKTLNGKKFPEGKGHGANIWLEDFRSTRQGAYTEPRKFGKDLTKYAKKYFKEYVFKTGDQVTFTTFDGDPHHFDNDEEEWYLSNRSIAKRVKDEVLFNEEDPSKSYLKYYIGPAGIATGLREITDGRSGKELKHTFTTPGKYDMRVVYRNGSDLWLRIIVKDPIPAPALKSFPLETDSNGIIHTRSLTADEVKWLGLSGDLAEKAMVAEVKEVKTRFAFKDGFRSYRDKPDGNNLANRWSKYNDYADAYVWLTTLDDIIVPYYKLPPNEKFYNNAQTFLKSYEAMMDNAKQTWMWKDWANHYSSVWKGKLKKDGLDGIPPYTSESTVTRLYELADLDKNFGTYIDREIFATRKYTDRKKAPWQYVIPLVSTTEYYGYRQRTNPSCIYDMRKVFDKNRGAFSGDPFNPDNLKPEYIQAPETPDETKNKQEFYYNLKYGRIAIVDKGSVNKTVRVYNVVGSNLNTVPNNKAEMKFVAQGTLHIPNNHIPIAHSINYKIVVGAVVATALGVGAITTAVLKRKSIKRRFIRRNFCSRRGKYNESEEFLLKEKLK